jgi:hypothetical protein
LNRSLSPFIACAVAASTGIDAVRSSIRNRFSASTPSMSGSRMSINTSAGRCSVASISACPPVDASSVR